VVWAVANAGSVGHVNIGQQVFEGRNRSPACRLHCIRDHSAAFIVDPVEQCLFETSFLLDPLAKDFERILRATLVQFCLAAIGLRIADEMAILPHALDLDGAWSSPGPGSLDGFARCFEDGEEVMTIDRPRWQAKTCRSLGDAVRADCVADPCPFAVAIVLEHENGWQT
jgi:hypothetical protein